MIIHLRDEEAFTGATPLLLGNLWAAARLEDALHEAGIPWRSVAESVSPDGSYEQTVQYGMFRRWVVFVRAADVERASSLASSEGFSPADRLPALFVGGALCSQHDYELDPCSGCSTGYDWWAKSDEAEKQTPPRRRPSPL